MKIDHDEQTYTCTNMRKYIVHLNTICGFEENYSYLINLCIMYIMYTFHNLPYETKIYIILKTIHRLN